MAQGIQPQDVAQFAEVGYYTAVRNPKWDNAEHTSITCEVNFMHVDFETWTPFCAHPDDYMPYSKMIFDDCANGKWGAVEEYVAPVEIELPAKVVAQDQPSASGVINL